MSCSASGRPHELANRGGEPIQLWRARRPLPAAPTLADVLCADWDNRIRLDVEPSPTAPTAVVVPHKNEIGACFGASCRRVAVPSYARRAVTDGTYVAVDTEGADYHTDIYRYADGAHLYTLDHCGASGFLDGVLLADGADCAGPSSSPYLADPATGKAIATLEFAHDNASAPHGLRALYVGGSRWAIVLNQGGNGQTCGAGIVDVHTGAVSESLRCEPSFTRVAASGETPIALADCPAPGRITHATHEPIGDDIWVNGLLAPAATTDVTSSVSGRIDAVKVAVDARVAKGDVLAIVAGTRVTAPIAGIVVARNVEPGQTVALGATPVVLFAIAPSLTELVLVSTDHDFRLRHVEIGLTTTVSADDRTFEGVVRAVSADTVEIAVHVPGGSLRSGTRAGAMVTISSQPGALTVPWEAIHLRPGPYDADATHLDRATVWLQRESKLVPVEVRTGVTAKNRVEIRDGLTDADAIALPLER